MHDLDAAQSRRRELKKVVAQVMEQIPFPKMEVVKQGLFRDTVVRRSVEELEQEELEQAARRARLRRTV